MDVSVLLYWYRYSRTDIPIYKYGYIGFGHIGTEISKGPDNKTNIVEPICPFKNIDKSVLDISVLLSGTLARSGPLAISVPIYPELYRKNMSH
jgi:hypothetical protein